MGITLIYITNKNKAETKKVALHLLKKKLIACANIFPIESVYRWKGKINNTKEYVALVKTKKANVGKIKKEVERIHSYECPCIIRFDASANEKFEKWVMSEIR